MNRLWLPLVSALLFTGCNTITPSGHPPVQQVPGNLISIEFNGITTDHPTSQILQQSGPAGFSKQNLTEVGSGLSFTSEGTTTFTVGGGRYLQATYLVNNNTGRTLSDLGFVPVVLSDTDGNSANNIMNPTIAGTPFASLKYFDGSDASSWATALIPTHAMSFDPASNRYLPSTEPSTYKEYLNTASYVPTNPSGLTISEVKNYGWKIQDPIPDGATGRVTFSIYFPTTSPSKNNPYSFSLVAAYTDGLPDVVTNTDDSLNVDASNYAMYFQTDMAPDGTPYAAWTENNRLYVKVFNGTSWSLLDTGAAQPAPFATVDFFSLKVGTDGKPRIMIRDYTDSTLHVYLWDGAFWNQMGTTLPANSSWSTSKMTLDASNLPVVTTDEGTDFKALHWTGSTWEAYGSSYVSWHFPNRVQIAMGPDQKPVVAYFAPSESAGGMIVKKWNGSTWDVLGGGSIHVNGNIITHSVTVDSQNNIHVAFEDDFSTYVKKWDGNTWTLLGGGSIQLPGRNGRNPVVAMDSLDIPHVVFRQWNMVTVAHYDALTGTWPQSNFITDIAGETPSLVYHGTTPMVSWKNGKLAMVRQDLVPSMDRVALDVNANATSSSGSLAIGPAGMSHVGWVEDSSVFVKQWNGSSWSQVGTSVKTLDSTASNSISLQVGMDNRAVVAVNDQSAHTVGVYRWSGSAWNQLGTDLSGSADADRPRMVLNSTGQPGVTYVESGNVYVKRWNGSSWILMGSELDIDSTQMAQAPSMTLGSDNLPVVAWKESTGGVDSLYVKKWTGSSWDLLGGTQLNVDSTQNISSPSITVDGSKNVYVSWSENGSIYAKKWNGTGWTLLGGGALQDGGQTGTLPVVGVNPAGTPHVLYLQSNGLYLKAYSAATDTWSTQGTSYAFSNAAQVTAGELAFAGVTPVVGWEENGNIHARK